MVAAFSFLLLLAFSLNTSAVQQAWIGKYGNGSNTISRPVALALDQDGNVHVAGRSTRSNAPFDEDYIIIKYNSLGVEQWANRFGVVGTNDVVKSLLITTNGAVFVTGTGGTVKYHSSGLLAWSASYAGRDLAVDADGNSYVTGFSTNDFSTVKLSDQGSNVWLRTWDHSGFGDVSEVLAIDASRNVFIAGRASVYCSRHGCDRRAYIVKYDEAGSQLWAILVTEAYLENLTAFNGFACDKEDNIILAASLYGLGGSAPWAIVKYHSNGDLFGWAVGLPRYGWSDGVMALALDDRGEVYATGAVPEGILQSYKLNSGLTNIWGSQYKAAPTGDNRGHAIAADKDGNAYVTGRSAGNSTGNDYATIKYGTNGQQLWVKRFTEAGNSDDQAQAIAVAPNGDVYVTGFSNPSPGTYEITTIKYIQLAPIEKKSNGNILLSFCGAPGSNYVIQACTALTNWTDLATVTATPAGLYTFEDTHAPSFPQRFYRTKQE